MMDGWIWYGRSSRLIAYIFACLMKSRLAKTTRSFCMNLMIIIISVFWMDSKNIETKYQWKFIIKKKLWPNMLRYWYNIYSVNPVCIAHNYMQLLFLFFTIQPCVEIWMEFNSTQKENINIIELQVRAILYWMSL